MTDVRPTVSVPNSKEPICDPDTGFMRRWILLFLDATYARLFSPNRDVILNTDKASTDKAGVVKQAEALADTSGLTLSELEDELNTLKQRLRDAGLMEP